MTPDPRYIRALAGLRGLAALWVFGYHVRSTLHDVFPGFPVGAAQNGYLAVDLFFVLSGFVLALNYAGRIRSRANFLSFIRNRLARLYPLHALTLVVLVAGFLVAARLGFQPNHPEHYVFDHHLVLQALLIHGWGFEDGLRWNVPSWSISAEFFLYLCFWPVSALALWRARRRTLLLSVVLVLAATVLGLRALGYESLHVPMGHALVRAGGEFLAGCLLFALYRQRVPDREAPRGLWSVLLLVCGGLALSPWADPWMAWGSCLVIYGLAADRRCLPARLLSCRPAVWLGTISYSIYLTHYLVIALVRRLVPEVARVGLGPGLGLAFTGGIVVAVLLVAAAAYYAVERPARRWLAVPVGSSGPAGLEPASPLRDGLQPTDHV